MRENTREIPLHRDYYDLGFNMYKKNKIKLKTGVTVLCGCNGTGKTTLLRQLREYLKKERIPHIYFDNLTDGGQNARQKAGALQDFKFLIPATLSSEGENIIMNIERLSYKIGGFIANGSIDSSVRWILLDAVDSGLSVDNICELKEDLFKTIFKYDGDKYDIYIVVVANEYEMARGEQCFDVYNGKYITFENYEEYRDFVLKSRELKNKRN